MRTLAVEGGTSNIALIIVLILAFVAMIGILAAVAIPAYQDYTIRAKVSQGLVYGSQYKAQVEEYAIQNQQWPESSDDINISENINSPIRPAQASLYCLLLDLITDLLPKFFKDLFALINFLA